MPSVHRRTLASAPRPTHTPVNGEREELTLPTALGDVDGVTLHHGRDSEADVARLAYCRRGRTLALLDRARDATANLQQGDVRRVEVERTANTCI